MWYSLSLLASGIVFSLVSAANINYGDMDDSTLDTMATTCVDPMVAAFKNEIESRSATCLSVRVKCDSVVASSSNPMGVIVDCVSPSDDTRPAPGATRLSRMRPVPEATQLSSMDSVLHSCDSNTDHTDKVLATAQEMLDRLCDGLQSAALSTSTFPARQFLDDIKTALQRSLKTPDQPALGAIGKFLLELIDAIKKESKCESAQIECPETSDNQRWKRLTVLFLQCPKAPEALMKKSTVAAEWNAYWTEAKGFGLRVVMGSDVVRKFRASAEANKQFRTSRIVKAMKLILCPSDALTKRDVSASEITKNAKGAKF